MDDIERALQFEDMLEGTHDVDDDEPEQWIERPLGEPESSEESIADADLLAAAALLEAELQTASAGRAAGVAPMFLADPPIELDQVSTSVGTEQVAPSAASGNLDTCKRVHKDICPSELGGFVSHIESTDSTESEATVGRLGLGGRVQRETPRPAHASSSPLDALARNLSGNSPDDPICGGGPCLDRARHRVSVKGSEVLFHFSDGPMRPQHELMSNVLDALNSQQHALLESPTGTGKTAAVLCAVLAWQRRLRAETGKAPQIVYASRTHAQLKQAMNELKATPYRPSSVVIGSRESGLCIHGPVLEEAHSGGIRAGCRSARRNNSCTFFTGLKSPELAAELVSNLHRGIAMDVEDLASLGKASQGCPYYMAHQLSAHSELVFCPYSYVLDSSVRQASGGVHEFSLSGRVIILDEAHNVSAVCCEVGSMEISIEQLKGVLFALRQLVGESSAPLQPATKRSKGDQEMGGFLPAAPRLIEPSEPSEQRLPKELTRSAQMVMAIFGRIMGYMERHVGIAVFAPHLGPEKQVSALLKKHLSLQYEPLFALSEGHKRKGIVTKAEAILAELRALDAAVPFVGHLNLASAVMAQLARAAQAPDQYAARADSSSTSSLHLWLLGAEVTLAPLAKVAHSMLLMSGTLTPMSATLSELGPTFGSRSRPPFQTDHVVTSKALTAVCIANLAGTKFDCNFRAWKKESFLLAVGNAIAMLCGVIPGGVLVFLPNYELLDRCVQSWQRSATRKRKGPVEKLQSAGDAVWEKLLAVKGVIVVESAPQHRAQESCGTAQPYLAAKRRYEAAIHTGGQALLLAVYRGRMSEGVSFSDNFARGVICVGMPYPNLTEERMKQKRLTNDFWLAQGTSKVSGDAFYESRALQAVAQALGRCIRHPADYGSLVLLDSRWEELGKVGGLPLWLQRFVAMSSDAVDAAGLLSKHFARIANELAADATITAAPKACSAGARFQHHFRPRPNSTTVVDLD